LTNNERSLYYLAMMSTDKAEAKMTCEACHFTCQRFGTHRNGLRRFRCLNCKKTYTEAHTRTLGTMYVSEDKAALAIQLLIEGNSIRSTERITKLDRNTIMRVLILAGQRCEKLMDAKMRELPCRRIQCDEIWTYVGKKARHVRKDDPAELGDQWIFVALDADTKLVPSFIVGKRSSANTQAFMRDLRSRIADHRIQLTTDAYIFCRKAVEESFGGDADFAQLTKLFGDYGQHDGPDARYSPPKITEVISKIRSGSPDPRHISTSFVERQNLTMRMQIRRLTRLTNAFSKKLVNLKAAIALHFAYYNFCRIHQTLRVTSAMEAGLTDHVWTIEELISLP
jgi:transposase-like protein/IS1 family transposase